MSPVPIDPVLSPLVGEIAVGRVEPGAVWVGIHLSCPTRHVVTTATVGTPVTKLLGPTPDNTIWCHVLTPGIAAKVVITQPQHFSPKLYLLKISNNCHFLPILTSPTTDSTGQGPHVVHSRANKVIPGVLLAVLNQPTVWSEDILDFTVVLFPGQHISLITFNSQFLSHGKKEVVENTPVLDIGCPARPS